MSGDADVTVDMPAQIVDQETNTTYEIITLDVVVYAFLRFQFNVLVFIRARVEQCLFLSIVPRVRNRARGTVLDNKHYFTRSN